MKTEFKVSIIIPVFNAERFVRRAVESAVQIAEVSEVNLVDDAGPDNSKVICQRLENEFANVRLLRHPDGLNHGAGASRNLGILHANSDYIAFLDADDYYLPNRFEKDREILQSNENVDGVYGAIGIHYESEDARTRFHGAGYGHQEFLTLSGPVPPEELLEVLFRCHPSVTGQFSTIGLTVRKSLFERSGLFNEQLRLSQDTHLWRRMAAVGRLVPGSIDQAVAIRGVHGANRMTDRTERAQYLDYWWDSLNDWFRTTSGVTKRAKRAFEQSFELYRMT